MPIPLRALLIEASHEDANRIVETLQQGSYNVAFERVDTPEALQRALHHADWDVILAEQALPLLTGLEALRLAKQAQPNVPFIIVSGMINEDAAIQSIKAGAADYVSKARIERLVSAVNRELREAAAHRQSRLTEEQLRQSEHLSATLFHASPIAAAICALENGKIIQINARFEELLGFRSDELIGKTPDELGIMSAAQLRAVLRTAEQTQYSLRNYELALLTKTGTRRDVLITANVIELDGKPHWLGFLYDITERKRIETTEREQRMFAEALQETAKILNSTLELDSVHDAILEQLGRVVPHDAAKIALIEGENARVIRYRGFNEDTISRIMPLPKRPLLRRIMRTQKPLMLTNTNYAKKRDTGPDLLWVRSLAATPILLLDNVIGFLIVYSASSNAFTQQHTQRLQAFAGQASIAIQNAQIYEAMLLQSQELEQRITMRTRQLRQSIERFQTILNSTSDALVLSSTNGIIDQINDACAREFGYSSEELSERSLLTLIHEDNKEAIAAAIRTVVTSGMPRRLELLARRRNGEEFAADVALTLTSSKEDAPILLCSIRDITERKQIEAELRRSLEREREVSELRQRFSSMLSHEFRNPLAVIQFSSSILRDYDQKLSNEKRLEHLAKIQTQVRRLVNLLDDYLMVTRSEKVAANFNPGPIDMRIFCRDIVDEMRLIDETHTIDVEITGDCLPVLIDARLMRQALTNLLSNAAKYSPNADRIDLRLRCAPDQIRIAVCDYGIGIPDDEQHRLFETFYRASNVGSIPGTGLGLAIIRQAVALHGGQVTFTSAVNKGTTFTITIPSQPPPLTHHQPPVDVNRGTGDVARPL